MNKEQVIESLKTLINSGQVTKNEVLSLFGETNSQRSRSVGIVNILYGIGGLVVLSGVVALAVQNWSEFTSVARILTTLGMSVVLYISSALLLKKYNVLSQILMAISLVLLPTGIGVTLNEMNLNVQIGTITLISVLLTLLSVATYFLLKKIVVGALFSVVFGTLSAYAFLTYILDKLDVLPNNPDIYLYLTLALGISHVFLAYFFSSPEKVYSHKAFGKFLYTTGTLGILTAAISLGGIWDVLFVLAVVGTFLLSVYVSSRSMLILSSLYLIGYLFKITGRYFEDSIGWPIALILIGILTIVIAIVTFRINQKYFNNAEQQLRSS